MSKTIEIVTHVYCPPGVDQYAEHLRWQFASLVRYGSCVGIRWTVCYTRDDPRTAELVVRLGKMIGDLTFGQFVLQGLDLAPSMLFRRAIGRDWAARNTTADVVWFTDADYVFGPGSLAATVAGVAGRSGLFMPAEIQIHRDHATGDADVAAGRAVRLPDPDPTHFLARRQKVCIGGVQIVDGDTARRVGYCGGTRWTEPVDPSLGFRSCRCDLAFRKLNGFSAVRLAIPNVYRLRHSRDGRDFDLTGEQIGKAVW